MITRCNQCGTKFEISDELVRAEDPTVRCGECLTLFNARAQLVADADDVPLLTRSVPDTASVKATKRKTSTSAVETSAIEKSAAPNPVPAAVAEVDLETADTLAFDSIDAQNPSAYTSNQSSHAADGYSDIDIKPDLDFSGAYSDRVDPIISSLNDQELSRSLEFENTLALSGLTGVEPDYNSSRADQMDDHRSGSDLFHLDQLRKHRASPKSAPAHKNDAGSLAAPGNAPLEPVNYRQGSGARTPELSEQAFYTANPAAESSRESAGQPNIAPGMSTPVAVAAAAAARGGNSSVGRTAPGPAVDTVTGLPEVTVGYDTSRNDDLIGDVHLAGDSAEGVSNADSALEVQRHMRSKGGAVYLDSEHDTEDSEASHGWFLPMIGLLIFACACLFLARNYIASLPLPPTVLSTFCSVTGCELPVHKDVDRLEIMRRKMFSHPSLENVLVISIDLLNKAPLPQLYPVIVVTMANGEGQPVAHRKFTPEEYQPDESQGLILSPNKPVRINFDIVDPGIDAQSFEIEFE
ncbi:hypothetical protein AB833_22550 [Chromatiales bacterium (ex Bugula neritina AB1)]|nr:hypothetical protein AB833_22550 [Chromatiales bacterium (ex Bugula neritina AB1)]